METAHICSFSGPRPYKLPAGGDERAPEIRELKTRLSSAVSSAIEGGYSVFLTGMAMGFDIFAGEALVLLRAAHPHIKLVAVCAFHDQHVRFQAAWKRRYARLIEAADATITLAPKYDPYCYFTRDRYLIDNSSLLICYYRGSGGGTGYTCDYARKRAHKIINIADDQ